MIIVLIEVAKQLVIQLVEMIFKTKRRKTMSNQKIAYKIGQAKGLALNLKQFADMQTKLINEIIQELNDEESKETKPKEIKKDVQKTRK
jgi:hypothetical protein